MFRLIVSVLTVVSMNVQAATTATLPPRKLVMAGDGQKLARYDLTAELKKQGLGGKDSGRLVRVEIKGKGGPSGAQIGLDMGDETVDSTTLMDDQETDIVLEGDAQGANPWTLAVRGELQIIELRVTLDGVVAPAPKPQPAPKPKAPVKPEPAAPESQNPTPKPVPPQPIPEPKPQPVPLPIPKPNGPLPITPTPQPAPARPEELRPGLQVIAVSRTSGRIENVRIVRRETDGTYTVTFDGEEFGGWSRNQLAIPTGCVNSFCVGQTVFWTRALYDGEVLVIGVLPNGQVVIEGVSIGRRVVGADELSRSSQGRRGDQRPVPRQEVPAEQPRPVPRRMVPGGRFWTPGQNVYYVDSMNRATAARILEMGASQVTLRLSDGRILSTNPSVDRLATMSGCSRSICVGASAFTRAGNGRPLEIVVMGIQSDVFVVVRDQKSGVTVGNWPAEALFPH